MVSSSILVLKVAEVGQGLDPKVRVLLGPLLLLVRLTLLRTSDSRVLTPLIHFVCLVVVYVKREQFLAQI